VDTAPDKTPAAGRFVRVHRAGCEPLPESPFMVGPVANGPRTPRPSVALTFDDGPSVYTAAVLRILEDEHVNATFFLVGGLVGPHADLVRRMLRDGDAVGNHSWSHPNLSTGDRRQSSSSRRRAARSPGSADSSPASSALRTAPGAPR
jgi:peptidoglycan/xylan/chitin deacetylase (PgdA/CDA1 family)